MKDTYWNQFMTTGKVTDYLSYRAESRPYSGEHGQETQGVPGSQADLQTGSRAVSQTDLQTGQQVNLQTSSRTGSQADPQTNPQTGSGGSVRREEASRPGRRQERESGG